MEKVKEKKRVEKRRDEYIQAEQAKREERA